MRATVLDIGGSGVKAARFSDGSLVQGSTQRFDNPNWEHFESWLADRLEVGAGPIGVSTAGFVDPANGLVELFRVGGWVDKPLQRDLERCFKRPVRVLNDAEAHLFAHSNLFDHPQLALALGTSPGFALTDDRGALIRPGDGSRNFDIGAWRIPTRAANSEVWWALGKEGLSVLQAAHGEEEGAARLGARLGGFVGMLCGVFQPRTVILSGGNSERWWGALRGPLRAEFERSRPSWLRAVAIEPSPYGSDAALFGMGKLLGGTAWARFIESMLPPR